MPRNLREYNSQEQEAFRSLFESEKYKSEPIFEAIASKLYRHEYCLVQHDLVEEVMGWFKEVGLQVRISEKGRIQTEIELL